MSILTGLLEGHVARAIGQSVHLLSSAGGRIGKGRQPSPPSACSQPHSPRTFCEIESLDMTFSHLQVRVKKFPFQDPGEKGGSWGCGGGGILQREV